MNFSARVACSMLLVLAACGSGRGGTSGSGAGGAGGQSSGAAGAASGGVRDAGHDVAEAGCPASACAVDGGSAARCDGKDVVTCGVDTDGCASESVITACAVGCSSGACCGEDGQSCCPGSLCGASAGCEHDSLMCSTCPTNFCQTHGYASGYYCDPSGAEVYCSRDVFSGCDDASTTPCAAACSPATGTCGGCDPKDPCFGFKAGMKVCPNTPNITMTTCEQAGSCVVAGPFVTCQMECEFPSGCCGTSGDPCCIGQTPSCLNNLTCNQGICG
jgi:hypothetical protein